MKQGDTVKIHFGDNQYVYGAIVKDWRTQENAMDYVGEDIHFYIHRRRRVSPVIYCATGSIEISNIKESKCVLTEKTIEEANFLKDDLTINLYADLEYVISGIRHFW